MLALAGCNVDATVDVRVREDGSGVVRLTVVADAEAVRAVESGGVQLDQAVRLTDLTEAGWEVEPWARAEDGSATLVLAHPFRNVSEVASIFADISGADGPLRSVRATRERGLFATEYALSGRADLENVQTGVPADEALVQSLVAQGVDVNVIDQQLLAQVKAAFTLEVVARLPGAKASTTTAKPGAVTRIAATSSVRDNQRIILLVAAGAFGLLAMLMWIRGGRRRRRRSHGRRPTDPTGPTRRSPEGPRPQPPAGVPRRPGPPAPRRAAGPMPQSPPTRRRPQQPPPQLPR